MCGNKLKNKNTKILLEFQYLKVLMDVVFNSKYILKYKLHDKFSNKMRQL